MKNIIKATLIISIIAVSFSLIWFILGSTACFQRNMDLIETVTIILVWLPAFALVVLTVFILKIGQFPVSVIAKTGLIIAITAASLFFAITLIRSTTLYGWIKENVEEDYIQITEDGKYEYCLELVNMFQKNSYARLRMKDIETGEETKIPLDIPTEEIIVLFRESDMVWSKLTPTDTENIFVFTTTELFDSENTYCFQIDVKAKSAKLLRQKQTQGDGSVVDNVTTTT